MLKNSLLLFLLLLGAIASNAQITDTTVLNKLGNFDMASLNGDSYGALLIGEQIVIDSAKLTQGIRINFFAKLAKAYDETEQNDKAIIYYQKVAAAAPDYFVVQRALGMLYNEQAEDIQLKLFRLAPNDPSYKTVSENYQNAVHKALPLLEKAQACDPDDDTLDLIETLYQNIGDEAGLNSFKQRLPELAARCVDLLDDK